MKYNNIQKPLVIRNKILKNRICASNSLPHFLQGPEGYPADTVIAHFENKAKAAAITTCTGINNFSRGKQLPMFADFGHMPDFELYDSASQNYLMQLADSIHYYQSLASMAILVGPPSAYPLMKKKATTDVIDPHNPIKLPGMEEYELEMIPAHNPVESYDEETLNKIADSYAEQCWLLSKLDYDMASIHMCYRGNLPAKFFSPITNHRTDKFGGSLENRMRFPLMVLQRIREKVGNNFLIEILWSSHEEGGYPIEDSIAFLNEAKKYIDIVQVRTGEIDPNHPTGFNLEETPFLKYAAQIKKECPGLIVGSVSGYQDLDTIEKALDDIDLVYAARAFISNTNYGEFIKEEANDEIVPCLRCNKCHGRGERDPFISVCSVNPTIGLEQKINRMISPVKTKKNVAIIGGGPAGMRCAIYIKERGHDVTIYEASDSLGGAIKHSDYVDFKWPLKKYKDYLINQMAKKEINVILNTKVKPEDIKGKYDVIIPSLGAHPSFPPIKGIQEANTMFAKNVFGHTENVGNNIVIIGGGEVGVECGIYLSKLGKKVTVLEMRDKLAADSTKIHYYTMFEEAWEKEENFTGLTSVKVMEVNTNQVIYEDVQGLHELIPDTIIISAGMKPYMEEALSFYGCAKEFYMLGDCAKPATIQQANRQAFAIAHQI